MLSDPGTRGGGSLSSFCLFFWRDSRSGLAAEFWEGLWASEITSVLALSLGRGLISRDGFYLFWRPVSRYLCLKPGADTAVPRAGEWTDRARSPGGG